MDARTMMLRKMEDCRKLKSFALLTVGLLSWAGSMSVNAAHPTSRRNHPATENPIVRVVKQPLDRSGRLLGVGWGDGYHGCYGSGFRPGADLPPRSSHATRRRTSWYGNTYYDRFDHHSIIHPRDYQVSGRSASHACDQNRDCDQLDGRNQDYAIEESDRDAVSNFTDESILNQLVFDSPTVSKASDRERGSVASKSEPKPISLAREVELPIALPKPIILPKPVALAKAAEPSSTITAPATTATRVAHPLPEVTRPVAAVEPRLPPVRDTSEKASPKPSRMPTIGAKPCRVAQFVPTPLPPAQLAEKTGTNKATTNERMANGLLPQQKPSRIAEVPQRVIDASEVQQNPFVR